MKSKFDLILENVYLETKTTVLEESAGAPDAVHVMNVITEAANALDKVKNFVKNNKGKLAAGAALAAGAGAAYAADKGYLGQGAQDAMHDAKDKLGFGGEAPKSEAPKQSITDSKKNEYSAEDNAQAQKELETKKPKFEKVKVAPVNQSNDNAISTINGQEYTSKDLHALDLAHARGEIDDKTFNTIMSKVSQNLNVK